MAIKWSVVSTVDAPFWLLSMHSAYLRDLGCNRVLYFIDRPDKLSASELDSFGDWVSLVRCDDAYWQSAGGRPAIVPGRQLKNLSFAKTILDDDFILHIDSDEFPLVYTSVDDILASFPDDTTSIRIQNVERVLLEGTSRWTEGILRRPVTKPGLVEEVYGPRSVFLGAGLSSYLHGKAFTRNRADVVASVHGEFVDDKEVTRTIIPLDQALLVHFDCISPVQWAQKIVLRAKEVESGRKMFRHERRMLQYVRQAPDPNAAVRTLVNLMHGATLEEAERWKAARVAQDMPDWFSAALAKAAGDPEWLERGFADRSMVAFYGIAPRG
jgi:hypothetical protein